jgi:hypothetical protein
VARVSRLPVAFPLFFTPTKIWPFEILNVYQYYWRDYDSYSVATS